MEIALAITSVLAVYFFIRGFRVSLRNVELQEKIKHQNDIIDIKSDAVQESFLKFVSDSRELAYEYIEEVQGGLKKFIKDIEPEIKYFEEYGSPVAIQPNYYSMKKVVEAYRELEKLLPKELDA